MPSLTTLPSLYSSCFTLFTCWFVLLTPCLVHFLCYLRKIFSTLAASMSNSWILLSFSILSSFGLLMVIIGQHKEMEIIEKKKEELKASEHMKSDQLQYQIDFKRTLHDLKTKGEHALKEVQSNIAQLAKELEGKKSESSACQEEMKITNEEAASVEETLKRTIETFAAESAVWKQEIANLKENLTLPSPICDYVKTKKEVMKLCATQAASN
ncbi:uncharacterized protein V3H82_019603 isoform 1-T1 [Fundulus diaphanus]